jgi:O-antigen/teichoic acid export membrane protein
VIVKSVDAPYGRFPTLHSGQMRERLVSALSAAVTFADQALSSACNFLATVLLARALGLEFFGLYSTIWLAIYLAMSLQLGLIVSPMISIGGKSSGPETDAYYAVVLVHQAIYVVVAAACLYITSMCLAVLMPKLGGVELPAAAVTAAYLTQDFLRRYLFARRRPVAVFFIDCINHGFKISLLGALWWDDLMDIQSALWAVTGAGALSILCGLLFVGPLVWEPRLFRQTTARQWASARWLVLTGSVQWILGYSGMLVTTALLGPHVLGALRAAQSLLAVMNVVREALENIVPLLAGKAFATGGLPSLRGVVVFAMLFALVVGGAAVIGIDIFGAWLLHFLYGSEMREFDWVIRWYSLIFPMALMNVVLSCALRAVESTRPIFLASLAAAGFNLFSIYPAAVFFGLAGVIAVALLSEFIVLVMLWIFSPDLRFESGNPTRLSRFLRFGVAAARSP